MPSDSKNMYSLSDKEIKIADSNELIDENPHYKDEFGAS